MRRLIFVGLALLGAMAAYQSATGNGYGTPGYQEGKVRPLLGGESSCVVLPGAGWAPSSCGPAAGKPADPRPEPERPSSAAGDFGGTASGGALTFAEVEAVWVRNGGDPAAARLAAAVASAESGRRPSAVNGSNTDGSIDRGLFQMNGVHGACSTFDLNQNTRCAIQLSRNGTNWRPWVAFNTGAHRRFLV